MKKTVLSLLAFALAACASVPEGMQKETPMNRVHYRCASGEQIEVRYFPLQGVAVLVREGRTLELQQQVSASGFWYSNGPTSLRGKGQQLTLEIGRMVPIQCEASDD
ncbi:MAG: hypothetical protein CGU28_08550 [Candidatus Dactylopiibacterium carminicum]|uniref:C-type lysozyme inhibitor domain-containing protein n=1 Tax=Candidatus Dactylopiibacterium carminicum TaxID=857335 RepID=A0A272ES11_9RHOO|nr:MliC family protein [Candidatus Dactylopiibacterium carminicum]KAF7598909.1 hypothetical protein BGI27_10575 [Candidatus Dactylopiibacterium carminicum]PAS92885.1 MAG: hypothetical protein CGU29_09660 [Candidatus Dactylopiibacterium carminicum]PAS96463.1 MAG: hypothetical protein CGU28_08550 [Candidatus Dactylopiibacterium carminicum]PAS98927.1 MAG: hypothetical protein BSR46_10595 [Candidatus Dactylopiibacterium carminicum]